MVEIKEKQELKVKNLLAFRGKVRRGELEAVGKDMQEKIQSSGARLVDNMMAATYAMDGESIEVEILMPLDKPIESVGEYKYIEQLWIENALVAIYKGNPAGVQEAFNSVMQYMNANKLRPITAVYNVTKKVDLLNIENTEIEMYVGVESAN